MHYCGDKLGPSRWNSILHLVAGVGIELSYYYNSSSKNSKTFPDYRYAGRSSQCLNERPDPEHIKDYTLLLRGSLLFKPARRIADSSRNCLVIYLLQDFFAIEPRRNKISWCGEVRELKVNRYTQAKHFTFLYAHTIVILFNRDPPVWGWFGQIVRSPFVPLDEVSVPMTILKFTLRSSTFSERLFAWFVSSTKSDKVSFFKIDWGSSSLSVLLLQCKPVQFLSIKRG